MARYRLRLTELDDAPLAIRATLVEVGRPIVTTSIALAIGFSVLSLSNFQPNATFGVLSGLTMMLALLGDLVLLPACLLVFGVTFNYSTSARTSADPPSPSVS